MVNMAAEHVGIGYSVHQNRRRRLSEDEEPQSGVAGVVGFDIILLLPDEIQHVVSRFEPLNSNETTTAQDRHERSLVGQH